MQPAGNIVSIILILALAFAFGAPAREAPAADQLEQVIKITAKKFEYSPNEIRIKKGVPVILEFTSLDRTHGFTIPEMDGIRATIEPGKTTRVRLVPQKAGTYDFFCDVFCGEGHENMTGRIIVEE